MLRLAALALRDQDHLRRSVARFTRDDRLVTAYVREQLLDGLDHDTLEFLVYVSPLEVLSGPLCDAVLARTGSGLCSVNSPEVRCPCGPSIARTRASACIRYSRVRCSRNYAASM